MKRFYEFDFDSAIKNSLANATFGIALNHELRLSFKRPLPMCANFAKEITRRLQKACNNDSIRFWWGGLDAIRAHSLYIMHDKEWNGKLLNMLDHFIKALGILIEINVLALEKADELKKTMLLFTKTLFLKKFVEELVKQRTGNKQQIESPTQQNTTPPFIDQLVKTCVPVMMNDPHKTETIFCNLEKNMLETVEFSSICHLSLLSFLNEKSNEMQEIRRIEEESSFKPCFNASFESMTL